MAARVGGKKLSCVHDRLLGAKRGRAHGAATANECVFKQMTFMSLIAHTYQPAPSPIVPEYRSKRDLVLLEIN